MITRRRLLALGAGAVVLAGAEAVHERARLVDALDPPGRAVPGSAPGEVVRGTFASAARGRDVRWELAYPPGSGPGDALPVALVLHGRGGDASQAFGSHALQRFLAEAVRSGVPPYALASVDGGDHTYWHRRADGDDPQAMLLDELLPLLAAKGLRTRRFGVTGWSMGGYGALLLAETVPARVAAVAVDAAALWQRAGDSAPGAFDGPQDFGRHDVLARAPALHGVPVRIGCGRSDPFLPVDRRLAHLLRTEVDVVAGGLTVGCWDLLRPRDLRFLGRHLAA